MIFVGRLRLPRNAFLLFYVPLAGVFLSVFCRTNHLGYPEFRSPRMLAAMIGNGLVTLAFLLTGSPLAAIVPHVFMHVAAVAHGPESTSQLPPGMRARRRTGGLGRRPGGRKRRWDEDS